MEQRAALEGQLLSCLYRQGGVFNTTQQFVPDSAYLTRPVVIATVCPLPHAQQLYMDIWMVQHLLLCSYAVQVMARMNASNAAIVTILPVLHFLQQRTALLCEVCRQPAGHMTNSSKAFQSVLCLAGC